MPDLGSRASSPPTNCQVFLGELWEEGHPEPLNQFKQEELVYIMRSIIQANCYSLNDRVHRSLSRLAMVKWLRAAFILTVLSHEPDLSAVHLLTLRSICVSSGFNFQRVQTSSPDPKIQSLHDRSLGLLFKISALI